MMKFTGVLRKMCLVVLCFATFGKTTNATVFTAVLSGNFNSTLTWGGIVPGSILSTDVIIIPSGITVTMTSSETFSGTSSLTVLGTLASTTGTALVMTSGTLAGSGAISADSMVLGLTSGFTFTGALTARKLTSLGATVTSAANVKVSKLLSLSSGILNMGAGSLTLGNGSTIALSGGTIITSGTGTLGLDSAHTVLYTVTSATAGLELTGAGVDSIIINTPGTISLAANTTVNGVLSLSMGTLALAGNTLTFGATGDLTASGTGTITGSALSNVVVNASGGLAGAVRFTTGSNLLNNLTANTGGSLSLGSNLTVQGALNLVAGKVKLGANNLMMAAGSVVTGGTATSYVVTDGAGSLVMNLAASATDTFKVGSVTNFAPIVLKANAGATTGDVSLNVADGVLSAGYTGTSISATDPLVNTTWFVSSTAGTVNYDMTTMWSTGAEVNGFNRTNAFISHYTGGAWDVTTPVSAGTYGSLHTMTRAGIMSLSPFTVKDGSALSAPVVTTVGQKVSVYPNPTAYKLNYTSTAPISSIEISNLTGQVVKTVDGANQSVTISELPAGTYFIHFYGNDVNSVQQFVKQ